VEVEADMEGVGVGSGPIVVLCVPPRSLASRCLSATWRTSTKT
jgi:hypothetical protein